MRDMIRKKRNAKGFTLAEVLVVVAILIILAGVSFVSVVQYQKNLRLMELDGTAKEIFIAAQNHLSLAQAAGELERLEEQDAGQGYLGTKLNTTPNYAGNAEGEYYYLIHNASGSTETYIPGNASGLHSLMLPYGAVDETVASGGNYVIVYERKSATVVAALYSGAGNASFGNASVIPFGDTDVQKIEEVYNDKDKRKSYEKDGVTAIVGCYTGEANNAPLPVKDLETPKLEVRNEERLHVIVSGKYTTDETITLYVKGQDSGTIAAKTLECTDGANSFDITLDDITGDGSLRFTKLISGSRFTKSENSEGNAFIPGENIEVYASVCTKSALATPKESARQTTSSLFGDENKGTEVYIKNLRHLENLSKAISDFDSTKIKDSAGNANTTGTIQAVQKNDITMLSFTDLQSQSIWCAGTMSETYVSVNTDYPLDYDGQGYAIHDLTMAAYFGDGSSAATQNAGIFGNVTAELSVKNLVLRNNKIPASSNAAASTANAGMLVGATEKDLTVEGVLAYYHEDDYNEDNDSAVEVTASGAVGGLIGLVNGGKLTITNSAAAVYVKGGTAAGGLIGEIKSADAGSAITQSYAGGHTKDGKYTEVGTDGSTGLSGAGRVNVQATKTTGYAGGLIGVSKSNNVTMDAVYSTASAYAKKEANSGSLVGQGAASMSDSDGYTEVQAASGYVKIKNDSTRKPNYYAVGTHNGTAAGDTDIAKAVLASDAKRRQATPYDRTLLPKTEDNKTQEEMNKTSYPLYSAGQLAGLLAVDGTSADAADAKKLPWFIKEHVGDWVLPSSKDSKFQVINGNRLTVRITDEALGASNAEANYVIKVHGEISKKDAYLVLRVKNGTVSSIFRINAITGEQWPTDLSNNNAKINATLKCVDFYLDDITRSDGHFVSVCDGFTAGEDITVNVVQPSSIGQRYGAYTINGAEFETSNEVKTNSLFGSIEANPTDSELVREHNEQKIEKVRAAISKLKLNITIPDQADTGLVTVDGKYYVQIDNARHLQNLSSAVSAGWGNSIYTTLAGAIQTDNIYWSGDAVATETAYKFNQSTAYTRSFVGEYYSDNNSKPNVYKKNGGNSEAGIFYPIGLNNNRNDLPFAYIGSAYKISGLDIDETANSGLFDTMPVNFSAFDLYIENVNINGTDTGALVGHTEDKTITISNVKLIADDGIIYTGYTQNKRTKNVISGSGETGGFVGSTKGVINITNSDIKGETEISSSGNTAAGLIGTASNQIAITNVTFDAKVMVNDTASDAKAGGFIGNAAGNKTINITNSTIGDTTNVTAESGYAAGIAASVDGSTTLQNVSATGELTVKGGTAAGGFIGVASGTALKIQSGELDTATITSTTADGDVAGLVATVNIGTEINNTKVNGKLTATGEGATGGFVGSATTKVTIKNNCQLSTAEIKSNKGDAAGLIAKTTCSGEAAEIDGAKVYGSVTVTGQNAAAGFVGSAAGKVTIKNQSALGTATITSKNGNAAGLLAETSSETVIQNTTVTGQLGVTGKNTAGGFVGSSTGKTEINGCELNAATVTSSAGRAAGVIAEASSKISSWQSDKIVEISNTKINSKLTAYGHTQAGGFIGYIGAYGSNNRTEVNVDFSVSASSVLEANITSDTQSAGGLVGYADGDSVVISKVKVIGADTEIKARENAGGLFGDLTARKEMSISDAAASAYINSSDNNAGGLIGRLYTQTDSGKETKLERSYYGGRTANGKYAAKSIGNYQYTSNVNAGHAAGGVIGWCEYVSNLQISQCFSTGSVYSSSDVGGQSAGGFFGSVWKGKITMSNCYSMGTVTGQTASSYNNISNFAGFIGSTGTSNTNQSGMTFDFTSGSVYYLKAFNTSSLSYIGKNYGNVDLTITSNKNVQEINNISTSDIEGTGNDLTSEANTHRYDTTLTGMYPYKNWTVETDENVTYYGDWPTISLDGAFVYYYPDSDKNFNTATGGQVTFYRYDGEIFDANLTLDSTSQLTKVEKQESFGIMIDSVTKHSDLTRLYQYATSSSWLVTKWESVKQIEGSSDGKEYEYTTLNYLGKKYYLYRITTPKASSVDTLWIKHLVGDMGTYKWTKSSKTWTKTS